MAALQIDVMKIKQLIFLKSKNVSNRKITEEMYPPPPNPSSLP